MKDKTEEKPLSEKIKIILGKVNNNYLESYKSESYNKGTDVVSLKRVKQIEEAIAHAVEKLKKELIRTDMSELHIEWNNDKIDEIFGDLKKEIEE